MICESCFYHSMNTDTCDYIFIEDRMRGCPGGDGCKKYISSSERERENKALRNYDATIERKAEKLRKIEELRRRQDLYDAGKTDVEISEATNTKVSTIATWRFRKGLKPNDDVKDPKMMYYLRGLSDGEIATLVGTKAKYIYEWRRRKKLKSNVEHCVTADKEDEMMRLYLDGNNDYEIADKLGISQMTVCRWRNKNGLIPNGLARK